ncbi:hypothetical protein FDUTEX481_04276 [Tolypothrix sp. PCC 7601]|nr:hypothetical protein FDUTEX481_04276 [Tolypothrix sp. PCC 7601]BAY95249.1 hypothetical protein NIES3275_73060 [Microchaete diplosiphon NIES-3275]
MTLAATISELNNIVQCIAGINLEDAVRNKDWVRPLLEET